jgi:DNA-directed RNA polymerase subunit H (RpoH/RPB5)
MNSHNNFEMTDIERQQYALSTITNMLIKRRWVSNDFDKHFNTLNVKSSELIDTTTIIHNDKKIVIKFYDIKLNSLKNDREIDTFFSKYPDYHKILIVSDIAPKTQKQINNTKNFEVFKIIEIIRDITKHHLVPDHEILNKTDAENFMSEYNFKKIDIGRIYIDDPMARYLYAQKDDIIRIIRPSIYSGYSTNYRLVLGGSIFT